MLAERERFVDGAVANGYERALAEHIFGLIEPFAGYAFNKAHAFSYATISWRTAWLKAHYPVEFMAAVLQCAAHDRFARALAECAQLGIEVLAPDINESSGNFSIERSVEDGDGPERSRIRFGMAQVKNVGVGVVAELLAARAAGGAFTSIEDFARRVPRSCNKRMVECLAKSGAFDTLAGGREKRGSVVGGVARIMTVAQEAQMQRETGQTSMFDLLGDEVATPLPALEIEHIETPSLEVLGWERDLLGACVSDHPFREASVALQEYVTHNASDIDRSLVGGEAVIAGAVTEVRKLTTKRGAEFAAVAIEDLTGTVEITIWPDAWEQHRAACEVGMALLAKVEVRERGERLTLSVDRIVPFDAAKGALAGPPPARPRQAPAAAGASEGQRRTGHTERTSNGQGGTTRPRTEPTQAQTAPGGTAEPPAPPVPQRLSAGAAAIPDTAMHAEEVAAAAVATGTETAMEQGESGPAPWDGAESTVACEPATAGEALPTLPELPELPELPSLPSLPVPEATELLVAPESGEPEGSGEPTLRIEIDETSSETDDGALVATLFELLAAHPGDGLVLLDVRATDGRLERFRLPMTDISAELASDLEAFGAKRASIEAS